MRTNCSSPTSYFSCRAIPSSVSGDIQRPVLVSSSSAPSYTCVPSACRRSGCDVHVVLPILVIVLIRVDIATLLDTVCVFIQC